MIEVENSQLLASQEALQQLAGKPLKGLHALCLGDVLEEAEGRLKRLQEVQQGLAEDVEEGEKTQTEADEEWQEVLQDTLEIDEERLPRSAFETIEISAQVLMALDWLIGEDEEQ